MKVKNLSLIQELSVDLNIFLVTSWGEVGYHGSENTCYAPPPFLLPELRNCDLISTISGSPCYFTQVLLPFDSINKGKNAAGYYYLLDSLPPSVDKRLNKEKVYWECWSSLFSCQVKTSFQISLFQQNYFSSSVWYK